MSFLKKILAAGILLFLFNNSFSQAPVITSFTPTSATQSTAIHIKGQYFTGTTAVSFGGVAALAFYLESDTSIQAYVNAGSTGSVAVTTFSGNTSLPGFTFLQKPLISSFSPLTGGYGDTIKIKGTNLLNTTAVTFNDSSARSFSILSDTIIKAVLGNGQSGSVAVRSETTVDFAYNFIHLGPAITSFTPITGSTGTVVTINGSHFTGATQVKFGNVPATSFTVQSDNLITATVGSGGPGAVAVSSAYGTGTLPGFITPTVQWVSPTSGSRGTVVYLEGTNFTGVTTVQFGDSVAASFTILNDGQMTATVAYGETGQLKIIKGSSFVDAGIFTYLPYIPNITGFTPASGRTGETITITGSHFLRASAVRFGDVPAASFTIVSDNQINAVVGNGYFGRIYVTNDGVTDSTDIGFTYLYSPPVISSFSPTAGPIGTNVTITGSDFGQTAAENIVYFGSVRANIISANATSITATVPPGADYLPISVTKGKLTGFSPKPFDITFSGAPSLFLDSSFAAQKKYTTTGSNPVRIVPGDFDGDGKTDLAVVYGFFGTTNNTVSVYRNISTGSNIDLAAPVDFNIGTQSYSGFDIAAADMDGDGKIDLVSVSGGDNTAGFLKNTCTPGVISFAPKVDFVVGSNQGPEGTAPENLAINDFDGDGKPDMVFACFGLDNWCKVTYMHNNTRDGGTIAFGSPINSSIVDAYNVATTDLNNDHKPDVAVGIYVNGSFMQQIAPLNNVSPGQTIISLQQNTNVGASNTLRTGFIAFADFDADGNTDMVSCNQNSSTISLFRNISTVGGNISFQTYSLITIGYGVGHAAVSDIDGDGKPDLVVNCNNNTVSVLKNISSPGTISFAPKVDYPTGRGPKGVILTDLDGDGKPEIITANESDTTISILKNKVGGILRLCPPSASTIAISNITGSSYQWQVNKNDGAGFVNISNNTNYSGATTATLQLNNIPSSFNGYIYRCYVNAASYSNQNKIQFFNKWTGTINSFWDNPGNWSCGVLPDGNTDVLIEGGTVIVNSNAICSTITINPGTNFTINPGINLVVTH